MLRYINSTRARGFEGLEVGELWPEFWSGAGQRCPEPVRDAKERNSTSTTLTFYGGS